ncbi:hypothetical protein CC78DRAFT_586055 [Lojkania enalia]|uniref:Zinc finger PHD-type domain-containing protein n=1 Tax=Lojkania enalia TaxID=147567 RepID=A0A9P4JZG8_9PLEO|nr:hypothetical protein CC78DRAFT_586055 [Didymosphaeria enalia]
MEYETTDVRTNENADYPTFPWPSGCYFPPITYKTLQTSESSGGDKAEERAAGLDLRNREQVDVGGIEDEIYVIASPGTSCLVVQFPTDPEHLITEAALRDYIKRSLPTQLIQDEYGRIENIQNIPCECLVSLQAKVWRDLPRYHAAMQCLKVNAVAEEDLNTAHVVRKIAGTLDAYHTFVIRSRSNSHSPCSYQLCQMTHHKLDTSYEGVEVALEPVIDEATLIPELEPNLFLGNILVFRRNHLKLLSWGFSADRFIPKTCAAFCFECLQFLWDRRISAWAIIDQWDNELDSVHLHAPSSIKKDKSATANHYDIENGEKYYNSYYDTEDGRVSTIDRLQATHNNDPPEKKQDPGSHKVKIEEDATLKNRMWSQMDGACDSNSLIQEIEALDVKMRMNGSEEIHNTMSSPSKRFLLQKSTPTAAWAAINAATKEESSKDLLLHMFNQKLEFLNKLDDPIASRPYLVAFRHNLQKKLHRGSSINRALSPMTEAQHEGLDFPMPLMHDAMSITSPCRDEGLQTTCKTGSFSANIMKEATKLCNTSNWQQYSIKTLKFSNTGNGSLHSPLDKGPVYEFSNTVAALTPIMGNDGKILFEVLSSDSLENISFKALAHSIPPPKRLVLIRKDKATEGCRTPSIIPSKNHLNERQDSRLSSPTLLQLTELSPAPRHIRLCCCCRQLNDESATIQCMNKDCPAGGRYHYLCLDKSQKLSSKRQNWVCDACTLVKWTECLPPISFDIPFTQREIVSALSTSRAVGMANPYGLRLVDPGVGVADVAECVKQLNLPDHMQEAEMQMDISLLVIQRLV